MPAKPRKMVSAQGGGGVAIVNQCVIGNLLRILNFYGVVFLARQGPLGCEERFYYGCCLACLGRWINFATPDHCSRSQGQFDPLFGWKVGASESNPSSRNGTT